tara:strand:+ start:2636 stop:3256 length:621 start_codon:yes stop_codon:yes gene_type:complete
MIKDYFNAIPIASELTNFLLNDFEKKKLLKLKYGGQDGHVKVSDDSRVLEDFDLKRVKNFIKLKVLEYTRDVLCIDNKLQMTQSWSTINKKGSSHHEHTHPNAFVSLVYYVDCDENSGDIMFIKDQSSIQEGYNFNFKLTQNNEYNSRCWKYKTAPGYICIFPGHIRHCSTPHNGDKDRIIIGANFFVKGTIGENENTDIIYINVK